MAKKTLAVLKAVKTLEDAMNAQPQFFPPQGVVVPVAPGPVPGAVPPVLAVVPFGPPAPGGQGPVGQHLAAPAQVPTAAVDAQPFSPFWEAAKECWASISIVQGAHSAITIYKILFSSFPSSFFSSSCGAGSWGLEARSSRPIWFFLLWCVG